MTTSEQKKIKDWVREAERRGWSVGIHGRGGHLKFFYPDGSIATVIPGSPGGGNRSIENIRAKLRRAGLKDIK